MVESKLYFCFTTVKKKKNPLEDENSYNLERQKLTSLYSVLKKKFLLELWPRSSQKYKCIRGSV